MSRENVGNKRENFRNKFLPSVFFHPTKRTESSMFFSLSIPPRRVRKVAMKAKKEALTYSRDR